MQSRWREEKQEALAEIGMTEAEIETQERLGYRVQEEMVRRVIDYYMQYREMKIQQSKYNPDYKEIRPVGRGAEYLKREGGSIKEIRLLAEGRMGTLGKAAEYWKQGKERLCRICEEKDETMRHMVEECVGRENKEGKLSELLDETGRGRQDLKKLKKTD